MSFILDALKKSEIERQRQSMPGLMDAPTSLRRGRLPVARDSRPGSRGIDCLIAGSLPGNGDPR